MEHLISMPGALCPNGHIKNERIKLYKIMFS